MTKNFPTLYQEIIYKSRYARWQDSLGRREHWPETVARYFNFFEEHLQEKHNFKLKKELRKELEESVLKLEVMPSMRALMTAGPALKRCNVGGYNCSYLPIDHVRAFDEILYILMCGTGVGFSVEHKDIDKLPIINEHFEKSSTVIVVDDSKAGWAKAFRELIAMLYAGQIPTWDLSKLRPAGAILKTFGGRSSGPEPLGDLFNFTVDKFTKAAGRRLASIECHDIVCKTGEIVVVGGVRRSALISLSNLDDRTMQESKSGRWWEMEPQRALANNSAVYSRTPDSVTFMEEWLSLVKSQSGERGIFNRQAAIKQASKNGRRDINQRFGTNPCCVSGDTLILTDKGHFPIEECVDKQIKIWNGDKFDFVTPYATGSQDTAIIKLSNGAEINCTWNHKFLLNGGNLVEVSNLKVGDALAKSNMPIIFGGEEFSIDAYSQGFYAGDGVAGQERSYLYDTKYAVKDRLKGRFCKEHTYGNSSRIGWVHGPMYDKNFVPINAKASYCLSWLAGLIDADGVSVQTNCGASSIQIASVDKAFLDKIRIMLSRLGCNAKVATMHKESGYKDMPNGKGESKAYLCQPVWRLLINAKDVYTLIENGMLLNRVKLNIDDSIVDKSRFVTVVSIDEFSEVETYCFTSSNKLGTFNGVLTGQSEIILRPYQFCNLTEVVLRPEDTFETVKAKVKIATILGTIQSTCTDFKYLRKAWKDNTEEERLLGVSLTGIFDNLKLDGKDLQQLRDYAVDVNKEYADKLNIPHSTAITCVKPSGTVSQLVDAASGIHPRHSRYYIRTIRGDKKDPLTNFLIDAGVPFEDEVMKPKDTVVFSFPQKAPSNARTREDLTSAVEHLKIWLDYQRYWCEHKPSVTISVRPDEWVEVAAWVYKHFDEVSGVSFLPHSEHTYKQAPYQECTKEDYEAMLVRMPKVINWEMLEDYEKEDNTVSQQTLACVAGTCEI